MACGPNRRGAGAAGSDSSSSPAREHLGEEDDRWDPPVSDGERRKGATRAGAEKEGLLLGRCWAEGATARERSREVQGASADFG